MNINFMDQLNIEIHEIWYSTNTDETTVDEKKIWFSLCTVWKKCLNKLLQRMCHTH